MRPAILIACAFVLVANAVPMLGQEAADQPPFTLTISGPQAVTVGNKILINAVLKNVSNRTIPIVWGDPYIRLIRDKNGKELPQNQDWDGSTSLGSIEPGKTFEESVPLGLEYDLMPGKYVVQLEKQIDIENPKSPIVKSNEITITVVPAQADSDKSQGPPFSITIKANPSVIQAGQKQQLFIAIELTNLSDHPMDNPSASMGGFDNVYDFEIRDSKGAQMPWAPLSTVTGFLPGQIQSGTLEPGKSKSEEVNITNFYRVDWSKPGTYTVQAKRFVYIKNPPEEGQAPIWDATRGEIKSNVITITVVPAKKEGSQ